MKDLKYSVFLFVGILSIIATALVAQPRNTGGPIPPFSGASVSYLVSGNTIQNIINNNSFSNASFTTINFDVVSNFEAITINTNVNFTQNISVSGKATFNNITVTNQLQFTTNAFPLAAGTTWNLTKPYQRIITNADFSIGSLGGLSNNVVNWGCLWWSNSDSSMHFCDLTALSVTPQGPNSTNKLYIGSGKTATISIASWGIGQQTNLITAAGQ